ncbi:MAG TPA: AMP-binding protein [Verrucomicrobiae bacterium]|nr:AMP-binding protein [Verrucomicrobiae bacterium]
MEGKSPGRGEIERAQLESLNGLLREIIPANRFYRRKLEENSTPASFNSLADYARDFPFTRKPEIAEDQRNNPIYGTNLTYPLDQYSRFHQTSGTTGRPLRWLDTPESWSGLVDSWMDVYRAAGVTPGEVVYFAFSFGPFLGFWLAFDAGNRLGCLCVPGGGQSSLVRLRTILDLQATVLCCTPSYAIHLAEIAAREELDLARSQVKLIIVAGEAGGSIPATRALIARLWNGARVFDHHGMTEVGPVTYECPARPCRLHVVNRAYLAEVVNPETLRAVPPLTPGELILTTLQRKGSPLLRYRTGDLVQLAAHHAKNEACACGRHETALEGGILGRTDDMVVVRGVNVYPAAVEQIIREFEEVAEFQARISKKQAMTELHLVIEPVAALKNPASLVSAVENALQSSLNLRVPVTTAPSGSLPRAELKSKRWIKE